MQTLIVQVDTKEHARKLTALLKKSKGVKSVSKEPKKYNWVSPLRSATDKELKDMLADCINSPLMTVAEAQNNTYGKLAKWKKQKK